jgi:hypothetical protein
MIGQFAVILKEALQGGKVAKVGLGSDLVLPVSSLLPSFAAKANGYRSYHSFCFH